MRKSRFSDEQMVAILREADRISVAEAAKKNAVSEQSIDAWRKHFGELRRLSSRYPRYGYRHIRIFLGREGLRMSTSRAERLWRKARLRLPRRRPRRRVAASCQLPAPAAAASGQPRLGIRLCVRCVRQWPVELQVLDHRRRVHP